ILSGPSASWVSSGAVPGPYTVALSVSGPAGTATAQRGVLLLAAAGDSFFSLPPCRLFDSRPATPLVSGSRRIIPAAGRCGIPQAAHAVAANLTVTQPTAPGFLSVYPGDDPWPLVSSLDFAAGSTRANAAVLPLSTDGAGTLAATLTLAQAGTAQLLLDVSGYFLATTAAPPPPLTFQARLCTFGFCAFPAGAPISFTESLPHATLYRYDWGGDGTLLETSAVPVASHLYPAPGIYSPSLDLTLPGGSHLTLRHPSPILVTLPTATPAAPAGLSAAFAGLLTASPLDPTLAGPLLAYQLTAGSPPAGLLGYNVYLSRNGQPFRFAVALSAALPPSEPLAIPAGSPADSLRILVTALALGGESVPGIPLELAHP
nr:PKD domain-containing protein [Acidobacteriota bacterium]